VRKAHPDSEPRANADPTQSERKADQERTQGGPRANARTQSERKADPERTQSERKIFKSEPRGRTPGSLWVRSGVRLRSVGTVLGLVRLLSYITYMAQHLVFSAFSPLFFGLPTFSGSSTTDETLLVEMRIWCIEIGIVLALHSLE
jgi:hypothetical protein